MRLLINGLSIELRGTAAISYDADTDELTIGAPAQKQLRIEGPRAKLIKRSTKKEELISEILTLLAARAPESIYKIGMTKALLGYPAPKEKAKYLHLLLTEMVDEGVIKRDQDKRSVIYSLP